MSGAQFFRIETYGLRARKPRKGAPATPWRTIDGVIAEAARTRGAATHVKGHSWACVVHGEHPSTIRDIAADQARRAVDRRGHRLREDGAALVAAVASYPVPFSDFTGSDAEETYFEWRDKVLAWFTNRWNGHMMSIVEHRDETYPHLHILAVPALLPDNRLNVGRLHPGIAARDQAQRAGHSTTIQTQAYLRAMRDLQDDYFSAVSQPLGHTRTGRVPRDRVSRQQAIKDRRQREREIELNVMEAMQERRSFAFESKQRRLEETEAHLRNNDAQISLIKEALKVEEKRLEDRKEAARQEFAEIKRHLLHNAEANKFEHERLVEARRLFMSSDKGLLANENIALKNELRKAYEILKQNGLLPTSAPSKKAG